MFRFLSVYLNLVLSILFTQHQDPFSFNHLTKSTFASFLPNVTLFGRHKNTQTKEMRLTKKRQSLSFDKAAIYLLLFLNSSLLCCTI